MKRLFKKNQIMITALALMIAVAGYLNFSGRLFGEDSAEADNELANQELLDISLEDVEDTGDIPNVEETPGEAVLTNGSSIVADAKVTREQVRAQNKETLMEIIDNENLTEEQKQAAVTEMIAMTKIAEQEASVETMLLTKGFSEAVVTLTENGADIVVNSEELTDANRAQIEDIVTRQTGIAPENIVINPMHE
ncbi:MAG: SpoIIIAH-like family protein [Tyzzerella sp.]|nr:SpoIIIAH-like family protein [Tyzzerella sp.]